jgi:hypothetical protein
MDGCLSRSTATTFVVVTSLMVVAVAFVWYTERRRRRETTESEHLSTVVDDPVAAAARSPPSPATSPAGMRPLRTLCHHTDTHCHPVPPNNNPLFRVQTNGPKRKNTCRPTPSHPRCFRRRPRHPTTRPATPPSRHPPPPPPLSRPVFCFFLGGEEDMGAKKKNCLGVTHNWSVARMDR